MKIIILGAGQVGAKITENLVNANNDITLIDLNGDRLKSISARLDIQTIQGNAAHPSVLTAAGAADCDLILALTRDDETNLVACHLASSLFNIPTKIARIRASDYVETPTQNPAETPLSLFNVDHVICPEQIVTDHIHQLFEYPGTLQVLDFAGGLLQLVVVIAAQGGLLIGKELRQIKQDLPEIDCRICAIYRAGRLVIPDGSTLIEEKDEVFFIATKENIPSILRELRRLSRPIKRVMIAGGGNIGYRLAAKLEEDFEVKIIENSKERCHFLSEALNDSLILHGEATDEGLLENENVDDMDVFCALTNDDEDNIMSALLAKRMGAKRVISLVNRAAYVDLFEGQKIDIVISPHLSTIGHILTHLRRGDVEGVHALRGGEVEAMEMILHGDEKTSQLVGRSIEAIKMPAGCFISAIIRTSAETGEAVALMAHHDLVLKSDDHLIIFVSSGKLIPEIEKLMQVKLGFF
jgi:trk system potassium uptake protein TrkA